VSKSLGGGEHPRLGLGEGVVGGGGSSSLADEKEGLILTGCDQSSNHSPSGGNNLQRENENFVHQIVSLWLERIGKKRGILEGT